MRRTGLILIFIVLICISVGVIFQPIFSVAYKVFGFDKPREYIVLFQNNMELRPTGGFMGSYGRIRVERGSITLVKIEDIYTPDGQLAGHTDPPWPIQSAFGQGWFKLRDSNFDPDFTKSAKTIVWFFEQGHEPKVDGIVAINLNFLQSMLDLVGPVYLLDEPEPITSQNFYKKTQKIVEKDFFPGSIAKRTFLSKLGSQVFMTLNNLPLTQKIRIPAIIFQQLKEKQILFVMFDEKVSEWLRARRFDGAIENMTRSKNSDYLSLFESNLGANKANCCIKRQARLKLETQNETLIHTLTLEYQNTNPTTLKKPPQYWGGAYVNFLRIGIPIDAQINSLEVGGIPYPISNLDAGDMKLNLIDLISSQTEEKQQGFIASQELASKRVDIDRRTQVGIKFIGFFVLVDALESKQVVLKYQSDATSSSRMYVQKQSGIDALPLILESEGKTKNYSISQDGFIEQ